MIKMNYVGEPFNYGSTGKQEYKMEVNIEMNDDATAGAVLDAVVRLMQAATYNVDVKTLASWLQNYAWERNQEKELNEFFGVTFEQEN